MQQAAAAQRAGRIAEAIGHYRAALRMQPGHPSVALVLGMLLARSGQPGEAIPLLERATALSPGNPDAWLALGTALGATGRVPEAAKAFSQALAIDPRNLAALVNLGGMLRRQGDAAAAIAHYRRALAIDPKLVQAQFNLGVALAADDQLEQAATAFEAARSLQPGYLPAANNLGDVLLRQGRAQEALDCFEQVRQRDPAFPRIDYQLGTALQALDRHAESADAFRAALARDGGDLDALNNLCIALLRAGDAQAALAASEDYLRLSPANRKPLAYKAAALVELGRREEAAELLDFEWLVLHHRPAPPLSDDNGSQAFNGQLAERLRAHPGLRFEPADKSTVGGSQTGELLDPADPLMVRLGELIRGGVDAYMQHLRERLPGHPYTLALPKRWRLGTWAVVLQRQGHQGPHFHPDGYVSGVYYVELPPDMAQAGEHDGFIEFGRTDSVFGGSQPPMTELVRPEEGLMLLFPSYLYHRTLPFESERPRISVAFDVLPAD